MKKAITILALFCIALNINAQQYLTGSEKWSQTQITSGWFGNSSVTKSLYYLNGDTVINNTVYKKMYQNYIDETVVSSTHQLIHSDTILNRYEAALRQSGDTIYGVYYGYEEEFIHKFNLKVGDTVDYKYGGRFPVNSVDSVPLGNTYRKTYTSYNVTLFEGIGFTGTGFLHGSPSGTVGLESGLTLQCYSNHQGRVLLAPAVPQCLDFLLPPVISSTQNSKEDVDPILFAPNPTHDQVNIRLPNAFNTLNQLRLEVYNLTGQKIPVEFVRSSDGMVVPTEHLPKGVYIFVVRSTEQTTTQKIFIN